jgi:hypothetical protein
MKTLVKTFAIAVLSVMSFVSNASDNNEPTGSIKKPFAVGMYQTANTLQMNVLIEKTTSKDLYVSLKDEAGNVLHKERVGKKGTVYHGKFDLSELQDGKYSFEITDGDTKVVKNVNIGTTKPEPVTNERFISMN